ncbi:MAG: hypothetical protein M3N31_08995 [Actinomycetota bacterium]|nr:hypothetical protein [Actinomycetota bacterium]
MSSEIKPLEPPPEDSPVELPPETLAFLVLSYRETIKAYPTAGVRSSLGTAALTTRMITQPRPD